MCATNQEGGSVLEHYEEMVSGADEQYGSVGKAARRPAQRTAWHFS